MKRKLFPKEGLERMTPFQRRLYRTSVFLGKLLLVGAVFQSIIFLSPSTTQIQSFYAGFLTQIMNFFGAEAFNRGIDIYMGNGSIYRIVQDCLGWKSVMMFTGLTFASHEERSLGKSLKYLTTGTVMIQVGNVVRILSTIYLAESGVISFEVIHGLFWTWGLAALVLLIWMYQERK